MATSATMISERCRGSGAIPPEGVDRTGSGSSRPRVPRSSIVEVTGGAFLWAPARCSLSGFGEGRDDTAAPGWRERRRSCGQSLRSAASSVTRTVIPAGASSSDTLPAETIRRRRITTRWSTVASAAARMWRDSTRHRKPRLTADQAATSPDWSTTAQALSRNREQDPLSATCLRREPLPGPYQQRTTAHRRATLKRASNQDSRRLFDIANTMAAATIPAGSEIPNRANRLRSVYIARVTVTTAMTMNSAVVAAAVPAERWG